MRVARTLKTERPPAADLASWKLRICVRGWVDERALVDVNVPLAGAGATHRYELRGGRLSLRLRLPPAQAAVASPNSSSAAAARCRRPFMAPAPRSGAR